MVRKSKTYIAPVVVALLSTYATTACKSDDDDEDKASEQANGGNNNTNGGGENSVAITGTINLLQLQGDTSVTHVIALDPESNNTAVAEVNADGSFELPIEKDANWVLTYVDATKTGEEALVSTFGAGELDTVALNETSSDIALGEVGVGTETATSSTPADQLLSQMAMSEDAAATYGAADDVSLRYTNPDIDGDGQIDAVAGQRFPLDFHNRFTMEKADGSALAMKDLKNQFPPEDVVLEFGGSGIIPWFEDSVWTTPVDSYSWTFTADVVTSSNGGQICDGLNQGDTLPAGTACNMTISGGGQSVTGKPSVELAAAVPGTYKLTAGGKTFTWTNIKVSDFSGGTGFIALFVRMDVSGDDKLTGISYSWRRKAADGSWAVATAEELKLLVNKQGGFVSFKVDGMNSGKEFGMRLPLTPEGSVEFATAVIGGDDGTVFIGDNAGITEDELRAGVAWSRVLENPGISYDDKLGMRFFMGINGPNN